VIAFVIAIFGILFNLDYDGLTGLIFKIVTASALIEATIASIFWILSKKLF
jgi:hypothetical protein